ncbi:tetratricopeptide repeat protein [Desulfobacterota bacterium M19]
MKKNIYLFTAFFYLLLPPLCALASDGALQVYADSYRYEKMADYNDAVKAIIPLYKKEPGNYFLNLRLGWLYYLKGKYGDSIACYRRAVEINPQSIEALLGQSLPLMAQHNWGEAGRLMNHVIKKDYYNFYANLRLAIALRLQNKAFLAEKIDRRMLQLYPASLDFMSELGRALKWQGKNKEARQVFINILRLDPQNVMARDTLKIK